MKLKFYWTLSLMFFMSAAFSMSAIAVEEDGGILDSVISVFTDSFVDFAGFVAGVVALVDVLKNLAPRVFQGNFLRWFSYLLPVAVAAAGYNWGWGFIGEATDWIAALIIGVMASASAFGWASMDLLRAILAALGKDPSIYRERKRAQVK